MKAFLAILLGFCLVACCAGSLLAQEASSPEPNQSNPVQVLRERTGPADMEFAQLEAATTAEWSSLMGGGEESFEKLRVKREDQKRETKALYQRAIKHLQKQPAAARLLTEYYVQWQATMESIDPKATESKMAYNLRMGDSIRKVSEAWYRFEAEWVE